jgi:beta-lactamase regulating signal transducer with metallopeptidase domain/5-hydroxyisourate hydrolase-like protein (transthyretin family)
MITLLDTVGPAVLRASWQAAVLALPVMLLLRLLKERVSPRWRYLLLSIVVVRLLVVATPASPWSAFNAIHLIPRISSQPLAQHATGQTRAPDAKVAPRNNPPETGRFVTATPPPRHIEPVAKMLAPEASVSAIPAEIPPDVIPPTNSPRPAPTIARILSSVWLAGFLFFGLHVLGAAVVLGRRLSACRPVTDAAVLSELHAACEQIGLRRRPRLLVTPQSISPCVVGTVRPRIILPESIVTESSNTTLRHVLAHELAHLVRGDLWTNWLLILAPTLHWFNPLAWYVIREMHAEREAACDELALAALGETNRSAYAATIIDLAASLAPSGMAPAMIGLIASTRRLTARIERLARSRSVSTIRAPLAAGIVFLVALMGLTDAMPPAAANQSTAKAEPSSEQGKPLEAQPVTLRGRCVDHVDGSPLVAATVRLFKVQGWTAPIVEITKTDTDPNGRFEFPLLTPPRPDDAVDRLFYMVFVEADDRPIGAGGIWNGHGREGNNIEIRMLREKTTLSGTVLSPRGRPVAGAAVAQWAIDGRAVPGILSATTGPDGRFLITRIPHYEWLRAGTKDRQGLTFTVSHADYPETALEVRDLPRNVTVTMPFGCQVTGIVTDSVTGRPASGTVVLAERLSEHSADITASTDAAGRFRMPVAEDRYNFYVRAKDRVCVALTDRECLAGNTLELPPFKLTGGGLISGQVKNAATGQPITLSEQGHTIIIGLIGPSEPRGSRIGVVDSAGRYTLRAAPGENFPYFVNLSGDRMQWDTEKQPAVKVKEGETTEYNMLVTPKVSPEERLGAARKLVASLSIKPSERTTQILLELRELKPTVENAELWCTLLRELVTVGHDAVPQVCAELDRTTEDRALRRLAFALRAIGDPRAVPALIRAIPIALLPASSDYGLIVADGALTEFMQKHDLREGGVGGRYFNFGRPVREIVGSLHKLTGQSFDDTELFGIHRSDDPRRQSQQRRVFTRHARQWQSWWEAHWQEFTDDAAFKTVNLKLDDAPLPPATTTFGPNARFEDSVHGMTLSPASEEGEHFLDLDTGSSPTWPAQLPRDEARVDQKQIAGWAAENGVDLMCVTHRAPDGKQTFVLRSFGMKAWEISQRDLRSIKKLIAAGTPPKGHDAGELLMHFDDQSKQSVPDANAAFIYVTREGSMGLIEITDRVTQKADLTGMVGEPPAGVGFQKGVRFNLKSIVP